MFKFYTSQIPLDMIDTINDNGFTRTQYLDNFLAKAIELGKFNILISSDVSAKIGLSDFVHGAGNIVITVKTDASLANNSVVLVK